MVYAAKRDSPVLEAPSQRVKWHVLVDGIAGCQAHIVLKKDAVPVPAERVPLTSRCMRSGCRYRWPKGVA